jgi:hypothetical protein
VIELYHEDDFTFRFAEPRVVGRFHLENVAPGTVVAVRRLRTPGDVVGEMVATATVGPGGWVEIEPALRVDAANGFRVRCVST